MAISGAGSGFDFTAITFSPDGRLFQVEYANKAVEKDSLAIGIRCKDGILLAAEKIKTKAMVPGANPKTFWIDQQTICATVGYRPDCLAAVHSARNEADNHMDTFGARISVSELAARVSMTFHGTHYIIGKRPYGAALLFGSAVDHALYALEPSGQFYGYKAISFGKNSKIANSDLNKQNWDDITVEEAIPKVVEIIKGLHDKQHKLWEIEISSIVGNSKPVNKFVDPTQ